MASSPTSAAIIFICPYGTSISAVRWAIRRLRHEGYRVVAYETTTAVFMAADPAILPDLISGVREDIRAQIARLRSEGTTEFGFFGSSLGSFILYNCIGDTLPELRWGVFNTGGDIAQGMWRLDPARRQHVLRGWSLARLEAAWAGLQWPEFGRLDGCRLVFASSRRDKIAPLGDVTPYLEPIRRAGAQVSVLEVRAIGHLTAIVAGLWQAPRIVAMVRPVVTGNPVGPTAKYRSFTVLPPGGPRLVPVRGVMPGQPGDALPSGNSVEDPAYEEDPDPQGACCRIG